MILTEFLYQKFDLFDRSAIESFNPGRAGAVPAARRRAGARAGGGLLGRGAPRARQRARGRLDRRPAPSPPERNLCP